MEVYESGYAGFVIPETEMVISCAASFASSKRICSIGSEDAI